MSQLRPHRWYAAPRQLVVTVLAAVVVLGMLIVPPACGPKPTSRPADDPAATQPGRTPAAVAKPVDDGADLSMMPGRIYLVQQGDTLYSLAERYYGHSKYWRKIWTANRNRLTNPNDLPVGMKLIIPP